MSLHVGSTVRPNLLSDLLVRDIEPELSRERVTILAGAGADRELTLGTVLGRVTASGKVVQLVPAAEDGSQTAWGVLIQDATAPDGVDGAGLAIARLAVVRADGLIWPAGISAPDKDAALAALEAKMIVAR